MNRPAAMAALALSFTLLAPLANVARAAGIEALDAPVPPAGPVGARRASVKGVTPRSFVFSDLPRRPTSENLPIKLRREHEWKELAELI